MPHIDKRLDEIEKKLDGMTRTPYPVFGNHISSSDDEIDLRELWKVIWSGKWIIIATTFVFAVVSVVFALSLPNIYKSEALLAPAEENSGGGLAGKLGQLGGLVSLAGVNLDGGADKTTLALEVLKSREFIFHFIEKHNLLVPIMAAKGWDREKDQLLIDPDIYSTSTNEWVRVVPSPKKAKPSMQEAYEEFSDRLQVVQDKRTEFVSISFSFFSPHLAKQWVDWLVEDINLEIKERDVAVANRSITYLTEQLEKTTIADMRTMFYELIEEQTKIVMFAEVRDEYVFSSIDKAVSPELKFKPKRGLIVILAVMLGGLLSVFGVLTFYFLRSNESQRY